jgi:hypothetical protein
VSQEYLRQVSLVVADAAGAGIELGAFRIVFTVRRGDFTSPNSIDACVYNLADATANQIENNEFTQISLSAGYAGNFGIVFRGTIIQTRKGRVDQKDTYVDITGADADEAYNFAPVFQSVPSGTTPGAIAGILQSALAAKGVTTAPPSFQFQQNGVIRGKVLYGMCRDELRDFAYTNNCKWSIQDGQSTFIPYTGYLPGTVPVISVATGLIGTPEQTQQGIKIRTLLNPNIRIGQLVKLQAQVNQFRFALDMPSQSQNPQLAQQIQVSGDGSYYVMAANFIGDSRGNDWYSDLTCLSVDASIAQQETVSNVFATGQVPTPVARYSK